MDNDTFENPNIYRTLTCITEYMNTLDNYKKAKVSVFLITLNKLCKNFGTIEIENRHYISQLLVSDYRIRVRNLCAQFNLEHYFETHLENYVVAKIWNNIGKHEKRNSL